MGKGDGRNTLFDDWLPFSFIFPPSLPLINDENPQTNKRITYNRTTSRVEKLCENHKMIE